MDDLLVEAVNRRTGAGLTVRGRSLHGELGGAVLVGAPDGRPLVVTVFHGPLADARRVARVVNLLAGRGLPLARHERVVAVDDRVVFVQQQLPAAPSRPLSARRVDAMVAANERFVGVLADVADVPGVAEWFQPPGAELRPLGDLVPPADRRATAVAATIDRLTAGAAAEALTGDDLVHVDLNAANVLFDEQDRVTGVVDWNLGVFRGDRRLALVQTRLDREWFVRRPDADPTETAAAHHLDAVLIARVDPGTLRTWWAFWLGHHLRQALVRADPDVIGWQLDLAEHRLG